MITSMIITKIFGEKVKDISGNVQIKNDIKITDIADSDSNLKGKFEYKAEFEPKVGEITIGGEFVYSMKDKKEAKTVSEDWKKTKKLPAEVSKDLITGILRTCSIRSVYISNLTNLPLTFPLPKLELK